MTPNENIEHALFAHVRDHVTQVPISWPNTEFDPALQTHQYLAVTHFRNQNERLYLRGTEQRRQGILQLSLVSLLGAGAPPSLALAGEITADFAQDTVLVSEGVKVRITKEPDTMSTLKTDVSWIIPISVYYEAFI